MENSVNGQMKKVFAVFVLFALTASMLFAVAPQAKAQDYVEWKTFAYIIVSPNPVGVNQQLIVQFRIDKTYPGGTVRGPFWEGFTVRITKPDGTVEERTGLRADSTGGSWFIYTPDQVGVYKFQTIFPGQWVNTTTPKRWYAPSQSRIVEITVQAEPIPPYPDAPLPTDYWERPINAEIKGAWQIADNWLMRGYDYLFRGFPGATAFAPYADAPDSPHILWTRQLWFGGVGGGKFGDKSYYTGLSYEQPYEPIILNGRIIYTEHDPAASGNIIGTRCLDLYTGEEIWFLDGVSITCAQVFDIENPNEHGLIAHLWSMSGPATSGTWTMYDAFTGRKILTIENVTWGGSQLVGGTTVFGPSGELINYYIDNAKKRFIVWNSSKAIFAAFPWIGGVQGAIYSPAAGAVIDGRLGVQLNVSIPDYLPPLSTGYPILGGEGVIIASAQDQSKYPIVYIHVAFDAETGQVLWVKNRTNIYGMWHRPSENVGSGIYVLYDEATTRLHAYDIRTGEEKWVSEPLNTLGENPSDFATFTRDYHIAYGKVYTAGFDGHVRAFDAETGKLVWDFYFGSSGYETPYGTWPVYAGFTIADGKVYVTNDEHSPDSVLWRGAKLWCLDAETGELLWKISGIFRNVAVADGYATSVNSYDGRIYVFGKGPSKVEVSAPQVAVTVGTSVLIRGKVLDMSPGQPNTPAVAKESMAEWMEYLHMQRQCPQEVKGVPVDLYAIYPDGTYNYIGTATTEPLAGGIFSFAFTPQQEGTYTIIAVFQGTESYGS
ncbi:PQQ-like beta-propeller repeat protein, partial [Candidatus Bathyarchaeota archaeon]|nr:PQQ-like beta-propeller repeat protein [Candidatus Bathyarchaeota archaeon]